MTINRFSSLLLLIGIFSCHPQATQQADVPPRQSEASCGCPFMSDQPAYTINQTPDSLTQYYLDVWKRAFIRRNNIDEVRFEALIKFVSGQLVTWREGVSFRVDYTYQLDWLRVRNYEQIRVKYDPVTTKDYVITVPRGVYLAESQIPFRDPWDENVQPIQLGAKLAFASCEDACQALKTKTGFSVLKPDRVSFYVPGNLPRIPGDPYLFSTGTIDSTANRCVGGQINLVTGEAKATENRCWIN